MKPDFLVVGHIVKDVVADGWLPGGGVLYAAAQARALGLKVGAVTRCAGDVKPETILPGIDWHVLPSEVTTSFENVYVDGHREQRVPAVAAPITINDIPLQWRDAPIALLAPVFQDVAPSVAAKIAARERLIGLGAQGWLRYLEDDRVVARDVDRTPAWLVGDVVFVSDEDVSDPEAVNVWKRHIRTVVLTRGIHGCTVWDEAGRFDVESLAVGEVDATGAGDVFATAFLIRQRETGNNHLAAEFAIAAAALAVQAKGITGIGARKDIDALLRREAVRG